MSHDKSNTICVVAILKEEDPFVEEWIAYHRLLGIDHFFLYDDDPRQPLNGLLAGHKDYVTVRPWLVDHDDERYPGRTKQLKAYLHALDRGVEIYDWVAFIDCDEFISLESHADIKDFLAEFDGYDSVSLNWHVFGHNGYYENPPGLVIECLTRRMKEPRPMTKTLTRTDAIASMDSPHFCRLKKGRKRVDANKRHTDELYPGKTAVARINHYQCRSFMNWMQKADRGEVGAFAEDPDNAWRFDREGCLRKFVTSIAVDKNEFVDTAMLRHVEPVKTYLGQHPRAERQHVPNVVPRKGFEATAFEALWWRASIEARLLQLDLSRVHKFLWALVSYQRERVKKIVSFRVGRNALHRATWASRLRRRSLAARWWQMAIERLGDDAPAGAYAELSKARLFDGDENMARTVALRGWAKHPDDTRLARFCAKLINQESDWRVAAPIWRSALDALDEVPPADLYLRLARVCRIQDQLDDAERFLSEAESAYPQLRFNIVAERLEIAWARRDWTQVEEIALMAATLMGADPARVTPRQFFIICAGLLLGDHFDRVISAVRLVEDRQRDNRWALAIEGLAYLRASRLDEAERLWIDYWQRASIDRDFALQRIPPLPSAHTPSKDFFSTVPHRSATLSQQTDVRFCIYTVLFGDYDDLRPPAYRPPGVDFICFSDRERYAPGWQVRVVDVGTESYAKASRHPKILPYDYLEGYDCSLYIDANVVLLTNPRELYQRFLEGRPFVAWPHPERASAYEEIEANLMRLKHKPEPLLRQHAFFQAESVPQQIGLIEAGFLWRDHRDPGVRALMEAWWDCLVRFDVSRDQPSLAYLMWKLGIRPEIMPAQLGTSRDNETYTKLPHKKPAPSIEAAPAGSGKESTARAFSGSTGRRLVWVCDRSHKTVASSLMRGYQLSELARAHLPDVTVACVDERQRDTQRDSMLFLTKGFLKRTNAEELASLKERGNVICVDYVDDPARQDLHECIDVYIASSLTQFVAYSKQYPDKCVHLVTHHPDPRINGVRAPEDRSRIGYFGEIVNARYATELRDRIHFCQVNTKVSEASWMAQLGDYNVHYAVRHHRAIDGFKPFVKGFTAAQCHSNIIVGNEDSEARYYLGSDYPYILRDNSLDAVKDMIDYVESSFGGAEWRRGMEIMDDVRRRCAPEQIAEEIRTLLARHL